MGEEASDFRFLYRTDKGRIDRAAWLRAAAPLAASFAVTTAIMLAVLPWANRPLSDAVVEAVDRAKGIVTNLAFVTVRGKQHQATIFTSGRVDDRAAKLKALETLARAAAARM